MDTETFDFWYNCDLEWKVIRTYIKMLSLVIFIITPSLKEIGL